MAGAKTLYEIEVSLVGIEPRIWRRLTIPADCRLPDLHQILQIAMGWFNCHCYYFEIGGKHYSDPEDELEDSLSDAALTLADALRESADGFEYVYDMGDDWIHEVRLVAKGTAAEDESAPLCLDGAGACPPEDVGGARGYRDFLWANKYPKHEQHKSFLDWAGGLFNPKAFDRRNVSSALVAWWAQRR